MWIRHLNLRVQEQTARIVPDTEATLYERNFFAFGPKYLRTAPCDTKTAIAPAMKNAGTRQVSTCADKYSRRAFQPPCSTCPSISTEDYYLSKLIIQACEALVVSRVLQTVLIQPGPTLTAVFSCSQSASICLFPSNPLRVASNISFRFTPISSQSIE